MKNIVAKPVGMFELFYDLVFVYAISRITAMIHHPVNGAIPLVTYAQFLLVVIVVMQIWLYQTLYFNRYNKNRFGDICGLLFNMFTAVYLANNINTDWRVTFYYFSLSMIAMLLDLILQYWLGAGKDDENDSRTFILILAIELVLVAIGVLIGYDRGGVYVAITGYLVGFLMPFTLYKKFQAKQVNFPHLVERVSLIIIIAFGEAIVNLANYFNSQTPILYAILLFISLCMMFASYVIFSEKIIDHHQISRGFLLMYSHIALIVAILTITVGILYLNMKGVNLTFVAWLLVASLDLYYLALFVNGVYGKKDYEWSKSNIVSLIIDFVFGATVLLATVPNLVLMMAFFLVWNMSYLTAIVLKVKNLK